MGQVTHHDKYNNLRYYNNHYLKNIRDDLLEESQNNFDNLRPSIVYVNALLQGVETELMIDTGANVSLIDRTEFQRIQELSTVKIPTLPITNVIIIGATGRPNKSVKLQALIDVSSDGIVIPMVFLVAIGLPFKVVIGCDTLQRHSAKIDLGKGTVTLYQDDSVWTGEIKGRKCTTHTPYSFTLVREDNYDRAPSPRRSEEEETWQSKLDEIYQFNSSKGPVITTEDKDRLVRIYNKYKNVFSDRPGKAKNFTCILEFQQQVKFNRKSYPIAQSLRSAVRQEITRMLDNDIIESSTSPYTSPIVAVEKKDGSVRLCLDAREINRNITNDRTSPGEIEEIMKRFQGVRYMSIWDAVCGYWQVELHPRSRPYVAFIFEGRNYQFKRLPFGLVNSVAIFVKCMDQILGREALDFTTVYVDDLLITSKTWEEHCDRVELVLKRLQDNNITLKLEKSKLVTNEIQFLGFVMNEDGITTAPEKVEVIRNFPIPKNLKQLQSFLGVCNYYRKFHKNYSELTTKFKHLLSTKYKWKWSDKDTETFQQIKDKFLDSVLLHHPNFQKRFFINCDASDISLGAELYQEDEEGNHLVVSFASRTLNSCERRYNVTEKELLSVVFACTKFRTYILGYQITVRSDHRSISFLQRCKLNHGRITRWILCLQEYNITWEYIPGKQNAVADALSRVNITDGTFNTERNEIGLVYNILTAKQELTELLEDIKREQSEDNKLIEITQRLEAGDEKVTQYYRQHQNIMFTKNHVADPNWKLYIPKSMETKMIRVYHELYGHIGAEKVTKALQEHIYMKGINKKIRNTIRTCKICQMVKVNNEKKEGAFITINSQKKLEKVFLDICGPFPRSGGRSGYRYIIIIFDHFTKYTKLYPINKATTQNILKIIFNRYANEVGKPESLLTDHGTQFKGKMWKRELNNAHIKTYKISVYHPSSNPAERVLREVGRILRTYCHDNHRSWSQVVHDAEDILNFAHHDTTGLPPYQVMFGKPTPRQITTLIDFPEVSEEPIDVMKLYTRIKGRAELRRRKQMKTGWTPIKYQVGEKVLIKNRQLPSSIEGIARKLLLLYIGPYTISKDNNNNTYTLINPVTNKVKGTYNQTELKKFYVE